MIRKISEFSDPLDLIQDALKNVLFRGFELSEIIALNFQVMNMNNTLSILSILQILHLFYNFRFLLF